MTLCMFDICTCESPKVLVRVLMYLHASTIVAVSLSCPT